MPRRSEDPTIAKARHADALTLLREGWPVRCVASVLECSPATVSLWWKAERAGKMHAWAWDGRKTGGHRWADPDRVRARAVRLRQVDPSAWLDYQRALQRRAVPAWLTATAVEAACMRMNVPLPARIDGVPVTAWWTALLPLAFRARPISPDDDPDERAAFLQSWESVHELFAFHAEQLGFRQDHHGHWYAPPLDEALAALKRRKMRDRWS